MLINLSGFGLGFSGLRSLLSILPLRLRGSLQAMLRLVVAGALSLCMSQAYCATKTLLVLGDSLSAEYGLARGSGWVTLLEKRLQEKKLDIKIVNASISGETTSGGKTRLPALLEQHKPAFVVLELGANDGLRGLPLAAMEQNLQAMSKMAQKSGAKVLLVGMQIPPNYGREYTAQFIATFERVAQSNKLPLVPFLLQGFAEKPEMFQNDRIHPLASAHPQMLNNVWQGLEPLLLPNRKGGK